MGGSLNTNMDLTRYAEQDYLRSGPVNVIPWTNTTGVDVVKGDYLLINLGTGRGLFAVAIEDIDAAAEGRIYIGGETFHEVRPAQRGVAQTFATLYQDVYYDPADALYYEATASGRALVGHVVVVEDSANVFIFEKYRRVSVDTST